MRNTERLVRENRILAKRQWGAELKSLRLDLLVALSRHHGFSIALGDLSLLDGKWYATHAGLLRLAHRRRCTGINVQQVGEFSDPPSSKWVFKATVYKAGTRRGFVGYGDADPTNVSPFVRGAEMRIAETRAVNRALRKAYGIGSVRSRNSAGHRSRLGPASRVRRIGLIPIPTASTVASPVCGTNFAF